MRRLFKLDNPVKHYDWGSPRWIPGLLGRDNPSGEPWAELWMGVHPGGPSTINAGSQRLGLPELIGGGPAQYLGPDLYRRYGGLPYLFKLLAAEKPLSIQAHPNLEQAREGWKRENRLGIPLDAPERNYRDPNHKPEIIAALTPFLAMCGFRQPVEIDFLLGALASGARRKAAEAIILLRAVLESSSGTGLREFIATLFGLDRETIGEIGAHILHQAPAPERALLWKTAARFARDYPGDPGLLAPLYLNLLSLKPGEGVFLPAGILHAYIEGLGVELMANSNNVLRGGLTSKHLDPKELFRVLRFEPFLPEILGQTAGDAPEGYYQYPTTAGEFSLSKIQGGKSPVTIPGEGPFIALVVRGRAVLTVPGDGGRETLVLDRGESAFIAWGKYPLSAGTTHEGDTGDYSLFIAGPGTIP